MRAWLTDTLTSDATLMTMLSGSVHQRGSTQNVRPERLYAVYTFGERSVEIKDDQTIKALRQPIQIWVHDDPGDYSAIEDALDRIRTLLTAKLGTRTDQLIRAVWLADSTDLFDPDTGDIVKYGQYDVFQTGG